MTNLNPIKKKLSKVDRKISMQDPSKLLAEFFNGVVIELDEEYKYCLLYTSPSPRDLSTSRMPSSA